MNIHIISKHMVKSSEKEGRVKRKHLNPFDLAAIKMKYINYGLVYRKPINSTIPITNLLSSFSKALTLFYPLAGRLVTTNNDDDTSISISLDSTNQGAEFIHASVPTMSIKDITSHDAQLSDLFPLIALIGIHGHDHPLLSVQATELSDGVFIAFSFNHVVCDGSSAWHFINTWSFYSLSENQEDAKPPQVPCFEPWCPTSYTLPIHLPRSFVDPPRNVNNVETQTLPRVRNRVFSISAESVAALKRRANTEVVDKNMKISSLQSVLAHAWRANVRARALEPEERASMVVIVGYRNRKIDPVVGKNYFGNIGCGVGIGASVRELQEESLGWTAGILNKGINLHGEEDVYRWVESWCQELRTYDSFDPERSNIVIVGESNRFDIYGNDFGWGRPIAFRNGWGHNDHGGVMKAVTGREEGSMDLDVALREGAMRALLEDEEFMSIVA